MLFSILIPAHNGEIYLKTSIESALKQTRQADEIILIDDASTDDTAKVAQSSEWSGRVKYYYNEHATGFVDAWNRSIEKSNGDFVTILHQDDLLHQDYLTHVEKALQSYQRVRHIYAGCNFIDSQGNIIGRTQGPYSFKPVLYSGKQYAHNYLDGVILNNHIHRCPGVATSRELLLNECTYRKEAGHIADDDFFLRVGTFTDVIGISQPLASFRHHSNSATAQLDLLSLKLAEAYVYQVRYHKENLTLLEFDDISKLKNNALNFITLLLFQSLLYKRNLWTDKAFELREDFDSLFPSYFMQNLLTWERILWRLTTASNQKNMLAKFYATSLNRIIRLRDYLLNLKVNAQTR